MEMGTGQSRRASIKRRLPFTNRRLTANGQRPTINLLILLFFTLYLLLGLLLVKDYGIGWDENVERESGLVTADYLNERFGGKLLDEPLTNIRLQEYKCRTYGVTFELTAFGLERLFRFDDPREWFLLRHYMNFLLFFLGLVFFYRLLNMRFQNKAFNLIGVVFMILSPRIFGDSFHNPKDLVFLSVFIINTWTMMRFLQRQDIWSTIYHGLVSAFLINVRIIGVIMPVITGLALFIMLLSNKISRQGISKIFVTALVYLTVLIILTVLLWPYLWEHPVSNFIAAFREMSRFPWDNENLYWGKFIPATHVPWHYILSWVLITTPVLYSVFFIIGVTRTISVLKAVAPGHRPPATDFVTLLLFFIPLILIIAFRSVLYDGWRQVFFLYVPFLMLAMTGFHETMTFVKNRLKPPIKGWAKVLVLLVVTVSLASTLTFMVRFHPHQNVYFNFVAGRETTKNFEADYWGLSYKQVLEHLVEYDKSDTVKVIAVNWPVKANAFILAPDQRKRLYFVDYDKADYCISNYRFPVEHDKFFKREVPYNNPIYEIMVRGNPISGVYRMR